MAFWKRLTDCVASHATSFLSRFEDPIVRTERAISLLKDLHKQSFDSLAQVKALIYTTEDDIKDRKKKAEELASRAVQILKAVEEGQTTQEKADQLAALSLSSKLKIEKEVTSLEEALVKYRKLEDNLEAKSAKIRQQISDCEFELTSLKSRMSVASTLKEISKSTNGLNDDSVASLLKDTESKVRNEEALAIAYESMEQLSDEEQIDAIIGSPLDQKVKEELEKVKASLHG